MATVSTIRLPSAIAMKLGGRLPARRQNVAGVPSASPTKGDRPNAGGSVVDSQERDHRMNDQALVREYDKAWREIAH